MLGGKWFNKILRDQSPEMLAGEKIYLKDQGSQDIYILPTKHRSLVKLFMYSQLNRNFSLSLDFKIQCNKNTYNKYSQYTLNSLCEKIILKTICFIT